MKVEELDLVEEAYILIFRTPYPDWVKRLFVKDMEIFSKCMRGLLGKMPICVQCEFTQLSTTPWEAYGSITTL